MKIFNKLNRKNILITGGAGFIGSNLAGELLKCGAKIICFDDLSTGNKKNINDFLSNKNFSFIKGDANNFDDLQKVFSSNRIDYVFHYAARVGVLRTLKYPLEVLQDLDGIKNILKLSHKHKVEKAIFSSSSEVYGQPVEIPENEDGHLNPKMPYAVVKLTGENYFKSYYEAHGLKTCSLRFFNVYGPRQDASSYGFVVGIFIKQAMAGKPLPVFGDGNQTRDFVFIEDNIRTSILALLKDETNGQSINIGTGRPITILDLAEKIIAMVGNHRAKIKFLPLRRGGEIKHRFPDTSKMRKLLEYRAKYTLGQGLEKTLEWYKKALK
jgi:UDP-glucose 4-epimerase